MSLNYSEAVKIGLITRVCIDLPAFFLSSCSAEVPKYLITLRNSFYFDRKKKKAGFFAEKLWVFINPC